MHEACDLIEGAVDGHYYCLTHKCRTETHLCWQARAEKAEAQAEEFEKEVINLSEDILLAKIAIQRVRDLHHPVDQEFADEGDEWCVECARGWDSDDFESIRYPCATIRALREQ